MAMINWNWVSPEMAANSVKTINDAANTNYEENQKRQANAIAASHIDASGNLTGGYYKAAADAGLGFDKIKQAAEYYTGQNAQNAQNVMNYNVIKQGGGDPGTTKSKTGLAAIYEQPPVAQQPVAQQPTASPQTGPLSANYSWMDGVARWIKSVFSHGGDKKPDDSSKEVIPSTDGKPDSVVVPVTDDGISKNFSYITPDNELFQSKNRMPWMDANGYYTQRAPESTDTTGFTTQDMVSSGTGYKAGDTEVIGQGQTGGGGGLAIDPNSLADQQYLSPSQPETAPADSEFVTQAPVAQPAQTPSSVPPVAQTTPAQAPSQPHPAGNDQPWFYNSYDAWKSPFDKTAGADSPDTYSNYFNVDKVKQTGNDATKRIPYGAAFKAAMGTLGQGDDQASVDALFKLSDSTVPVPTGAFMPGADGKVNMQGGVQALSDYKAKIEEKRLELAKALQKGDADQISTILGYKNLDIAKSNLKIAKENLGISKANLDISQQKNARENTEFGQEQAPIAELKAAGWHNVNNNNIEHVQALRTAEGRLVSTRAHLMDVENHTEKYTTEQGAMACASAISTLLDADNAITEGAREDIKRQANIALDPGLLKAFASDGKEGVAKWVTANGVKKTAANLLVLNDYVIRSGKDSQDAFKNYGHPFGAAPKPKSARRGPQVGDVDARGRVWTGKKWIKPGN